MRTRSINAIKSAKYQSINLKDAVVFRKEIISESSELPYVGLENIESNTGFYTPSTEEKESFNSALKFEVGDVLFPKLRPYLNKVHLAQFNGVCSTEFHVLKGKNLNDLYLFTFLSSKLVVNQTTCLMTGNTLPRLQTQDVKRLPTLLPPLEIQNHLAEIMQSAYDQKRQKDQEADDLLNSIDDYVLAELGIRMPALEEKKCFAVYANETAGRRVDPYYHSPYFKKLYSAISNHAQVLSLKNLVSELDYGLMPTQDYADSNDTGVPMIRVTNLLPDGSIDMSEVKYIPFDTPRLNLKRVKADDILMVQCGNTTGKIALVPKCFKDYTFGSFLFVIRGKREIVNQHYLFAILSNRLIQEQIRHTWNIVTVRPNTSKPNVKNLLIPLPTPEIQDRIAKEVMGRKSQALKLRQAAVEEWEAAKTQVEKQLLSGEVS